MPFPSFAWHLPLVLATPFLLAALGALPCLLVRRPALAWAVAVPPVALQLLLLARLDLLDQLSGPAVTLFRPHLLSLGAGLAGGVLLPWWCRPRPRTLDWRRPAGWRWCLQLACVLGLPLIPLPALALAAVACFHGRRPAWRHRHLAWASPLAVLILSPLWLLGPRTASLATAGSCMVLATALPADRRGIGLLGVAAVHLGMCWWAA